LLKQLLNIPGAHGRRGGHESDGENEFLHDIVLLKHRRFACQLIKNAIVLLAVKAIRGATGASGIFLLYEPTRRLDEDRGGYLDRFMRTNKPLWRVLTPAEWDQLLR